MSERKGAKRRDETEETGDVRVASSVCLCVVMMCALVMCVGSSNRGHVCAFSESGERSGRALRSASRAEMIYRVLSVCAIRVRAAAASILFVNTRRPRTAPRTPRPPPPRNTFLRRPLPIHTTLTPPHIPATHHTTPASHNSHLSSARHHPIATTPPPPLSTAGRPSMRGPTRSCPG